MTQPRPIESARPVFDDVVRRLGADPAGPAAVLEVFVAFADVRFAVPDGPELEALGKRAVWAMSTGRESVRDRWTEVSDGPCWPVLRSRTPAASEIGQSGV